ncbi:MAG: biotin/lipoyl-binding protein, partial [Flavobacteriia bacterium]|nr:biotin/lipoyl-binding protein [Flavobacteriia bacterium]
MPNEHKSTYHTTSGSAGSRSRFGKKKAIQLSLAIFFVFLLAWIFHKNLLHEWNVEVTRAAVLPNASHNLLDTYDANLTRGDVLFQATGWIEPDPFPIAATSLYSGVVKKVHVLEGQKVAKGETIVSLIAEDAKLALAEAKAFFSQSIAEEAETEAEIEHAQASLQMILSQSQ